MADYEERIDKTAESIVKDLGLDLEENPPPMKTLIESLELRQTAKRLVELVDALPHAEVWISVDDSDVWLNFQSYDMRIDSGVMIGTVDDDSKDLLRKLSIALDAAIVGTMAQKHEDKIEETGKELE